MKKSGILRTNYEQLRLGIINEIGSLVRKHKAIEMEVEFEEGVFFASGLDEQDEPQLITSVDEERAKIFHQGNDIGTKLLTHLATDILLKIVEALETSLEETEKFVKK